MADSDEIGDEVAGGKYQRGRRNYYTCLDEILYWLEKAARRIEPFRELFLTAGASDISNLELPAELPKAWLHLLMSLVYCTEEELTDFDRHVRRFNELLDEGMRKIVRGVSKGSLLENLVVAPTELAFLISFQLGQDLTKTFP